MTKLDLFRLAKRTERLCNNPDADSDVIIDTARHLAECVIKQIGDVTCKQK